MKRLFLFATFALICSGQQKEHIIRFVPNPAGTESGEGQFLDLNSDARYVSVAAPTSVAAITITAVSAANPAVLTLSSNAPATVQPGSKLTITGAAGTGCTGLNAQQTVTAAAGMSVTISFDATGCTYTASSGSFRPNLRFRLPRESAVGCLVDDGNQNISVDPTCTAATAAGLPVSDSSVIVFNTTDNTKKLKFDISGFATATTEIVGFRSSAGSTDGTYTIPGMALGSFAHPQLWTGSQWFRPPDDADHDGTLFFFHAGTDNLARADWVTQIDSEPGQRLRINRAGSIDLGSPSSDCAVGFCSDIEMHTRDSSSADKVLGVTVGATTQGMHLGLNSGSNSKVSEVIFRQAGTYKYQVGVDGNGFFFINDSVSGSNALLYYNPANHISAFSYGNVLLDTQTTGLQASVLFDSHGTGLWQLGKDTDDSFFLWDNTHSKKTWGVQTGGDFFFNANVLANTNNTFNIGTSGSRFNTAFVSNLDGAPAGTTGNFVSTRRVMIADFTGGAPTWEIRAFSLGLNQYMVFNDNAGATKFQLINNQTVANVNEARFGYNVTPDTDSTWDLGKTGLKWRDLWLSGTCHGCVPSDMMTTDTAQTVTGTKTFSVSIPFSADDTYNIAANGARVNTVFTYNLDAAPGGTVNNYVMTRRHIVVDENGGSPSWEMKASASAVTSYLYFQDNAANVKVKFLNNIAGVGFNQAQFDFNIVPMSDATRDLGTSGLRFRDLWLSGVCHGCPSIPSDMMTTDTAQSVTGLKTWSASIFVGADNTYNLGTTTSAIATLPAHRMLTEREDICQPSTGFGTCWSFTTGSTALTLNDNSARTRAQFVTGAVFHPNPYTLFYEDVMPDSDNARNLGFPSGFKWSTVYAYTYDISNQITGTFNLNGNMTVGSTANFYNRSVGGSTGISCSGVANGWTAVTSDDYVVVCMGGNRFRAELVSF